MADRCSHGHRLGCCDECSEAHERAEMVADAVADRLRCGDGDDLTLETLDLRLQIIESREGGRVDAENLKDRIKILEVERDRSRREWHSTEDRHRSALGRISDLRMAVDVAADPGSKPFRDALRLLFSTNSYTCPDWLKDPG